MRLVDASGGIRDGPTSLLWDSKIELSEKFFNEIIRHPAPLNMNTLTALKRSPLGLDLYLWLVYRTFALRAPNQDFHFGPGTVTGYTPAAPNTTSFRAEPCTSPPPVGARARPSAHRR